jgi:uncharacterized protein YkwD
VKSKWKTFSGIMLLLMGFSISACQTEPGKSVINPVSSSASNELEIESTSKPQMTVKTQSLSSLPTKTNNVDSAENADSKATSTLAPHPTLATVPTRKEVSDCQAAGNPSFEEETLALVNQEREKNNLPPLTMNHLLVAAARVHSADMACHNYFSHQGLDGSSPFKRMESSGYQMSYASENIYAGPEEFNTPAQAVRYWMNSPSHRASILNPHYTEAGVGYYFFKPATYDGYFTIDFASPAVTDAPSKGN